MENKSGQMFGMEVVSQPSASSSRSLSEQLSINDFPQVKKELRELMNMPKSNTCISHEINNHFVRERIKGIM